MNKTRIILGSLLVLVGIIIAGFLFYAGEMDDAPGLCAIGISIGFVLSLWGIKQFGVIKKGLFTPILLLFFGLFIAAIITALLIDNEAANANWIYYVGYFISLILCIASIRLFWKFFKKKKD